MASRKINNSIKNKEDLTHLRAMALGEAALEPEKRRAETGKKTYCRRRKIGLWYQILQRIKIILKVH